MMDMPTLALLIAGAAAGGFVNGLAGFGTALFSLGFWLQIFPPIEAVAIGVAMSSVTGLQGLWVVRHQILDQPKRLARFLFPAIVAIPIGIYSLAYIDPKALKLIIAGFLILYGLFFLLRRSLPKFERRTPIWDSIIGFFAGALGGLAGLSGALPAMWCALRPWPRHETRAVLQPFNFVVLFLSVLILAYRGAYTGGLLVALSIALVTGVIAAQIGIAVFKRMNDVQFRWLLIVLMFLSGTVLMIRELV